MKHKKITTSSGYLIDVYDNVFTFSERTNFFNFLLNSKYRVNGGDSFNRSYQIFSEFNLEDMKNSGLMNTIGFQEINEKYNLLNRPIKQIRINFSPTSEQNRIHDDAAGLTLLYYATVDWNLDWGGHTLFMDNTLEEAEYTCIYKPGRVVVFDGRIPHMIMTPTNLAEIPRYSLAIQVGENA